MEDGNVRLRRERLDIGKEYYDLTFSTGRDVPVTAPLQWVSFLSSLIQILEGTYRK